MIPFPVVEFASFLSVPTIENLEIFKILNPIKCKGATIKFLKLNCFIEPIEDALTSLGVAALAAYF